MNKFLSLLVTLCALISISYKDMLAQRRWGEIKSPQQMEFEKAELIEGLKVASDFVRSLESEEKYQQRKEIVDFINGRPPFLSKLKQIGLTIDIWDPHVSSIVSILGFEASAIFRGACVSVQCMFDEEIKVTLRGLQKKDLEVRFSNIGIAYGPNPTATYGIKDSYSTDLKFSGTAHIVVGRNYFELKQIDFRD